MKKVFYTSIFLLSLTACSIFGVHFKIHNPKRPGKYPEQTEARALLGNQESKYRTCFDVNYYYLSVRFGNNLKKDKAISGTSGILITAKTDFDTLQFDLHAAMNLSALHSGTVSSSGISVEEELKFVRKGGSVFVIFPNKVLAGSRIGLIADFSGIPDDAKRPPWRGGFVRSQDDLKNPWWGVACQTEGASSWWFCKDVVNDEPDSVDVDLWVPDGCIAVSNGMPVAASARYFSNPGLQNKLSPFCWHVSNPINLYNITFYIGKYKLLHDEYISKITGDTLQLNHYVLEQHYEKAKEHFKQTKEYLAFYEEQFGSYAFYKDGFKLVESPYAGMEHQSAIAYGNGFKNDPKYGFDYIILHETAHEWWGNALTAEDLADGWLHEGFATYSEALFIEHKFGFAEYENYLRNYRNFIVNRRPVVAPYGMRYFNFRDSDIYMKGAWILHSLRYTMHNDSLFFDVLKTFYTRFKYQNARSSDFEKLVNEKTGKDFTWFFDQYLRNRFTPELEYCMKNDQLYYRWTKTNTHFPMTAKVQMAGYVPSMVSLPDSTGGVHSVPLRDNSGIGKFNDREFLYKPVKNKKLAKEKQ